MKSNPSSNQDFRGQWRKVNLSSLLVSCSYRSRFSFILILLILLEAGSSFRASAETRSSPSYPQPTEQNAHFTGGDLIFTDSAAALLKYNATTGETTPLLSRGLLVQPFGIAIAGDQTVYISDTGCPGVIEVHPGTGRTRMLAKGPDLGTPYGIAVGSKGQIYVANGQCIQAIEPINGQLRLISKGGLLRAPVALAFSPDGVLYVADAGGSVVAIEPRTRSQRLVTSGLFLSGASGITLGGPDRLFVTDSLSRRVVEVDTRTGEQALISAEGDLVTPVGIVVGNQNTLLIGDPDTFGLSGGIIQVDITTGAQTRYVSGSGPFVNPRCVAILPPSLRTTVSKQ